MAEQPTEQGAPAPPPQPPSVPDEDRSVGELIFDVSERVSILVREEIELAKAEITEKLADARPRAGIVGPPPASSCSAR